MLRTFKKGAGKIDNDIFENGWNNLNAYAFGWIMSDGCLMKAGRNKTSYVVIIASNDREIIEWLHSYLCVGNRIYKQGEKCFVVKYRNKPSIDFMRSNKLTERKSLSVELPDIPQEYFGDFLRGYFDGNGSIILRHTRYNTYAQASITSGSKKLLDAMCEKLSEFGIESHLYKDGRSANNSYYLRVIKRSELEKFFDLMYKTSTDETRLGRKFDKYKLYLDCKPKYNIVEPHDIV